jgi:hypothetical protein
MSALSVATNETTGRGRLAPAVRVARPRQLRLLPHGDGWSLVNLDGELVYSALGTRGRRECLRFAEAHGVIALMS